MTNFNEITIRSTILSDVDEVAILFDSYRQFYGQAPDLVLAKTFIAERISKQESFILVAKNQNESKEKNLIGFCQIYPSFCSVVAAKIGILYDLFVAESARKTGAGRALMQAAHEYAANNGMVRLDLTTAKDNVKAQALYESLGWVQDDVFYTYNKGIINS